MVLFPPPFYFVFDISNLLSYIQNNFKLRARSPRNGNHFLVVNKSDLIHVLVHLVGVEVPQEHYEIVYKLT